MLTKRTSRLTGAEENLPTLTEARRSRAINFSAMAPAADDAARADTAAAAAEAAAAADVIVAVVLVLDVADGICVAK